MSHVALGEKSLPRAYDNGVSALHKTCVFQEGCPVLVMQAANVHDKAC